MGVYFEEFKFTNCKAEVDLSLCECNLSAATDLPLNFLQVTFTSWSVFPMEGQFIHAIHVPFYGKMLNWSQIKASQHCRWIAVAGCHREGMELGAGTESPGGLSGAVFLQKRQMCMEMVTPAFGTALSFFFFYSFGGSSGSSQTGFPGHWNN